MHPRPLVYVMHHTILVIAISCKGQGLTQSDRLWIEVKTQSVVVLFWLTFSAPLCITCTVTRADVVTKPMVTGHTTSNTKDTIADDNGST